MSTLPRSGNGNERKLGRGASDDHAIPARYVRWMRLHLPDGSFMRLIGTVAAPFATVAHSSSPPASQSASASIDSH